MECHVNMHVIYCDEHQKELSQHFFIFWDFLNVCLPSEFKWEVKILRLHKIKHFRKILLNVIHFHLDFFWITKNSLKLHQDISHIHSLSCAKHFSHTKITVALSIYSHIYKFLRTPMEKSRYYNLLLLIAC